MGLFDAITSFFSGGSSSSPSSSGSKSTPPAPSRSSTPSSGSGSGSKSSGSSSSSGSNWRNSSAGIAISLGTATTEQKQEAISQGASASNVGLSTGSKSTTPSFNGVQIGGNTIKDAIENSPTPTVSQQVAKQAAEAKEQATQPTQSTGGGSNIAPPSNPSNVAPTTPSQSNITATPDKRTWELTYTNAETVNDPKRTTETWLSSDGTQVAFAGISASDLADYYVEKGDYESAAKFAEITYQSGNAPETSSSGWRNTSMGSNISTGTATAQEKIDAMKLGASASNVGLFETIEVFEKTPSYQESHPDESPYGILYTGGGDNPTKAYDGGSIISDGKGGAYALDEDGKLIHTSDVSTWNLDAGGGSNIAPSPNPSNVAPTDPNPSNITPNEDRYTINITIPTNEPEASGSGGDSLLSEMLAALFLANLNRDNGSGNNGSSSGDSWVEPETETETETIDWKQYLLPAAIVGAGIIGAVAIFGGKK